MNGIKNIPEIVKYHSTEKRACTGLSEPRFFKTTTKNPAFESMSIRSRKMPANEKPPARAEG